LVRQIADAGLKVIGAGGPSATPLASMPRNAGQSTPGRGAALEGDCAGSAAVPLSRTAARPVSQRECAFMCFASADDAITAI
jgi:hypothetical protein